jgi:hypothetical protein
MHVVPIINKVATFDATKTSYHQHLNTKYSITSTGYNYPTTYDAWTYDILCTCSTTNHQHYYQYLTYMHSPTISPSFDIYAFTNTNYILQFQHFIKFLTIQVKEKIHHTMINVMPSLLFNYFSWDRVELYDWFNYVICWYFIEWLYFIIY